MRRFVVAPVDVVPAMPPEIASETPGTKERFGIDAMTVRVTTTGVVGNLTVILDPDFASTSASDEEVILIADEPKTPPLNVNTIGPV